MGSFHTQFSKVIVSFNTKSLGNMKNIHEELEGNGYGNLLSRGELGGTSSRFSKYRKCLQNKIRHVDS